MRKNIVAGNWKMNTVLEEGVELANNVNSLLEGKTVNCDVTGRKAARTPARSAPRW